MEPSYGVGGSRRLWARYLGSFKHYCVRGNLMQALQRLSLYWQQQSKHSLLSLPGQIFYGPMGAYVLRPWKNRTYRGLLFVTGSIDCFRMPTEPMRRNLNDRYVRKAELLTKIDKGLVGSGASSTDCRPCFTPGVPKPGVVSSLNKGERKMLRSGLQDGLHTSWYIACVLLQTSAWISPVCIVAVPRSPPENEVVACSRQGCMNSRRGQRGRWSCCCNFTFEPSGEFL